jgi:hypothetical protein
MIPEHEVVPQIISEVVGLEHSIKAIACVMVMEDGSIKTKHAYTEGQRLLLLAGLSLQQNELCRSISTEPHNVLGPKR